MNEAVIALGSNIDPAKNIRNAINEISKVHIVKRQSRIVRTRPVGFRHQPDFLNGVVLVLTEMQQADLKRWLRGIEADLGRIRTERIDGPRTIDLDIALWNGKVVDNDVYERGFLRRAIREVLPGYQFQPCSQC